MKLFGEYLLEQKLVAEQDLFAAILEQDSELPSIPEIAAELKLISVTDTLKALAHQVRNRVDFITACKDLGLWSAEIEQKIDSHLQTVRTPLGQILYATGKISLGDLTKAFDEFVSVHTKERESLAADPILEQKEDLPLSKDPKIFTPRFLPLDQEFVSGYITLLTELKLDYLLGLIKTEPLDLENLYLEFHIIKGTARFVGASLSEELCTRVEEVIAKVRSSSPAPGDVKELLTKTVDILWSLRNHLKDKNSEEPYWENSEQKDHLIAHLNELDLFCR